MPRWESVFGHDFEVPKFVQYLTNQKKILQDISYGNDTSPSFGVWSPASDRRVVFWVDHPIQSRRENLGERFHVQRDSEIVFSSNDLEPALESLFLELGKFHAEQAPSGPKEWRPKGIGPKIILEWQGKLAELIDEYFDEYKRTR
jgi:hypothetical protein